MKTLKRIFWFVLTNFMVMMTISLLANFFGVTNYLTQKGINYSQLFALSLLVGFTGSFISLFLSKYMAKLFLGVKSVNENSAYMSLVSKVQNIASTAGFAQCPEIGVYDSAEVNAFATGFSEKHSLVAFSTGLLNKMNDKELEGVIAHEISHIKNGDMVTMTLLQGVINTFSFFLSRVIAYLIVSRDKNQNNRNSFRLVTFLVEIALSFLGMIVLCYFSRKREYSADHDAGILVGNDKMIAALEKLKSLFEFNQHNESSKNVSVQAMKISGSKIFKLFSTHPPLQERIEALRM